MFHESFCDFLMGGPSNSEKKLRQNFPIFVSRVLVTWTGDLFTTHFSRENRVFCDLRTIFKKKFSFPSFILIVHFLVRSSLSQTHHVSHKNPPFFFIISTSNFKKRYGFSIFLKAFHVYNLWFHDSWVVEIQKMRCLNMGWVYFVEVGE